MQEQELPLLEHLHQEASSGCLVMGGGP